MKVTAAGASSTTTSGGRGNVRKKGTDGGRNVRGNTFSHCTREFLKTLSMRLLPWHMCSPHHAATLMVAGEFQPGVQRLAL